MKSLPLLLDPEQATQRICGDCSACCYVLQIEAFRKGLYTPCQHQTAPPVNGGCGIYDSKPHECGYYKCLWRLGQVQGDERRRPDRLGLILDGREDSRGVLIVCWETRPGASEESPARWVMERLLNRLPRLQLVLHGAERVYEVRQGWRLTDVTREFHDDVFVRRMLLSAGFGDLGARKEYLKYVEAQNQKGGGA